MRHHPGYTLQLDCRHGPPPRLGDVFTLPVTRHQQFEVISVTPYATPQRRPDGTFATHLIRYRRKK